MDYRHMTRPQSKFVDRYHGSVWDKTIQHIYINHYMATITVIDDRVLTGYIDGFDEQTIYLTTNTNLGRSSTIFPKTHITSISFSGENLFRKYGDE